MAQEKKIDVNFCTYLPYDHIPYTCINLGKITSDQLDKLMTEFEKNKSRPHTCIQTMHIDFSDTLSFGRLPGDGIRRRTMELSDMFYFYDTDNSHPVTPCLSGPRYPKGEDAMVRTCAHNLRCGKCQDEFIRRTLGTALFPKFYANEKQK